MLRYPRINEFLDLLHSRRISSFLVTNAQFPEEIRTLRPVCQLYVSVDASTKVCAVAFGTPFAQQLVMVITSDKYILMHLIVVG
jgi:hypothetical protein